MPKDADLYLDRIAFDSYLPRESCELCRVSSRDEFLDRLGRGQRPTGTCVHWPPERVAAFSSALSARDSLPALPMLEVPRPVEPGLLELNPPASGSPLLVTGNSELTQTVMLAIVSRASSPLRILFTDTLGHTVDMAMVFQVLTAGRIAAAIEKAGLGLAEPSRIVLPGLAREVCSPLAQALGRAVETGPVCAAELPLYLTDDWRETA